MTSLRIIEMLKKRHRQFFLWSKTEQKMYREPFLILIFVSSSDFRQKIVSRTRKLKLKTNYTQRVKR